MMEDIIAMWLLRIFGIWTVALGTVFLVLTIYMLISDGFSKGVFGMLLGGLGGVFAGWGMILQSQGRMD